MGIKSKLLLISLSGLLLSNTANVYSATTDKNNRAIASNQKHLDKVVAIVNDSVITNKELNYEISKIKKQNLYGNNQLPSTDTLKKQVLNQLILDKLQYEMAEMNNMTADTAQINAAIDNIAKQNNVNIFALKSMMEKEGIDFNQFREDLKKQLTIMNVQKAAVSSDITISEQELQKALEQIKSQNNKNRYRVSQILLSVPDEPSPEQIKYAKNRAQEIYNDLKQGKDFAKTASVASDGQQALNGGDLGWFSPSELPSIFTEIVPKLKKNQIYGPIQSESGFHIVKLTDLDVDTKKYSETKYKARHILIKKDKITDSTIAKQELKKIKQEIESKNNFSDLALIYSDDYGSASRGGELGWVSKNAVVPEFGEVLESLKENEISPPFETTYGWHIVQLEAKKNVDNTTKVEENIARNMLAQQKSQDALASWQNKLRSQAHVKVMI